MSLYKVDLTFARMLLLLFPLYFKFCHLLVTKEALKSFGFSEDSRQRSGWKTALLEISLSSLLIMVMDKISYSGRRAVMI